MRAMLPVRPASWLAHSFRRPEFISIPDHTRYLRTALAAFGHLHRAIACRAPMARRREGHAEVDLARRATASPSDAGRRHAAWPPARWRGQFNMVQPHLKRAARRASG